MAIARMRSVVIDCPDPKGLADFYGALLDWKITNVEDDWVTLTDGESGGRLCFQLAPDHRPPSWPDSELPQQFHLDLAVDDLDEAEARTLALGAVKHSHQPDAEDDDFRVFLDPAGHPFCLCLV
ncbi:VOC family protein [Streptosporangium pseudovulgare]|uniref:Glyoxalase n=1 Tax=Streptosporangium pseudovulgare TaxID=35765 RepID=A0ABQ2QMP7_9ACTN|nr:VOC family protein [Streptosporangium pseudovulgare]GGP85478.1 glyoxalase [Streptosporangium pseudovulgare]